MVKGVTSLARGSTINASHNAFDGEIAAKLKALFIGGQGAHLFIPANTQRLSNVHTTFLTFK